MANEIGFSTIYPSSGLGSAGPIGATGATGANQSVRGSTGATGLDSNYITSVLVNQETGRVEFGLSDGTNVSPGILQGATGVYAGVTASSLGSGISVLRGVCGGITLDFYNFRTAGLLGITYSTDGALVFTISANSGAGGISPSIENNRIVYAQSKTTIMSTDLIPQASNSANKIQPNDINYGYVNFGGETAGRNIVADITDSSLSVGPIERGEFTVNLSDFYSTGVEGITLDLSRATVYNLVTPLGIKAFTTSNIGTIPLGQIMSVTLIVHGEDIWNFPEDVVFDAESKPIFYPGVNILHMWKTNTDVNWRASFTARGIGARPRSDGKIENPGVRGSCCYFDVDGTKHCDDYVTQTYCTERDGNFEGTVPCDKNSCIVGEGKEFDGVCCTEGRCVSDIDPSLCQTIGGYFISGITCGQEGLYPDDNAENYSVPGTESGLCYNQCKTPTICCKNGTCLGQLTEEHCDYLEGITVRGANDCNSAKCCDHIIAPGACCTQNPNGSYICTEVQTPYECNTTSGGIYMGKNTTCNPTEDICCTVANQITCYDCTTDINGLCSCTQVSAIGENCENEGYYTSETCNGECAHNKCHKCVGTDCTEETTGCGEACSSGFTPGECVSSVTCQTKKCFALCANNFCASSDIPLQFGNDTNTPCQNLSAGFPLDICNCPPPAEPEYAACFWCFPIILDSTGVLNSSGNREVVPPNAPPSPGNSAEFVGQVAGSSQAPFRSVFSVSQSKVLLLDAAAGYTENGFVIQAQIPTGNVGITLPAGLNPAGYSLSRLNDILYYDETDTSAFNPDAIGMAVPNNRGEVLNARVGPVTFSPNTLISTDINFRCNYVGSYKTSNNKSETRENCLKRYGYTTPEQLTNCLLCDPVNDNIQYRDLSNESDLTVSKIEPYQDRIKDGLYAPFPPLWGRITYKYGVSTCTTAVYKKNTYNLNLLTPIDIKDMTHEFILQRGKTWLKTFLNKYDSPIPVVSNGANLQLYNGLITSISSAFAQNTSAIVNTPVPDNEPCLGSQNNATRFIYDPYRLGGSIIYGAAYVWPSTRDTCCFSPEFSWALPQPSMDLISQTTSGDSAAMYYPPDANGGANERIQSVGERYLRKFNSDNTTDVKYVRGIFGRNLRYNLDSFRTSTVFYHDDGTGTDTFTTTMKTNENIKIPLAYQDGFESAVSCWPPAGSGSGSLDAPLCEAAVDCNALCGCGECAETSPGICENPFGGPTLCAVYNGGQGGSASNWQNTGGLIAPSTVETPSPFKAQAVNKSQITTKRVYIIPGVCVDMLCPECNSYESC